MTVNHDPPAPDALGVARYIALVTEELARLAKNQDLEALAYLLEMARLEASQVSRQNGGGAPRGD
jgi:hypothetical protein